MSDLIDLGKNIQPDSFESDISIGVLRVTDVWTNFLVADPVQPVEDQYVVPAPSDLVGWFQSHPYLRLSELTSTTVAGYPAARFTADVPPLPAEAEGTCHGERCTMLFSLESPAGYTSQWEGEHVTYWVVDATAHRFVITMIINPDATPEEADVLAGEGEAIVASIQIR